MPDFTVAQRATDTSGRPILATAYFWQVWLAVLADERLRSIAWKVVVVQGAFMSRLGGGAAASAGYHDLGGCWDVRTWNLTASEQQLVWDVAAEYGVWFWKRDLSYAHGGMDEHGHAIAGWDAPLASGAAYQWVQAKQGRDGLARNGPDYMLRRRPIVTSPPPNLLTKEYLMTSPAEDKLDEALSLLKSLDKSTEKLSDAERRRWTKQKDWKQQSTKRLGGIADQLGSLAEPAQKGKSTEDQLKALRQAVRGLRGDVLQLLSEDPDVDGADNPVHPTESTQE